MKHIKLILFLVSVILNILIFSNLYSQIQNRILVKVGDSLVTSLDLQNDVNTNIIINKKELTQINVDKYKDYSLKSLINKTIKKNEIKKYKIKDYNRKDLINYIQKVAKNLNTNQPGLKEIFKQNNIDYQKFEENYEIELLWNTLIYQIYKDQINVNTIEINNEIKSIKENKSEEDLKKIKQNILNKKKTRN